MGGAPLSQHALRRFAVSEGIQKLEQNVSGTMKHDPFGQHDGPGGHGENQEAQHDQFDYDSGMRHHFKNRER